MRLEQIKEELVVLQSSLTQEGEIRMEGDEEWAQWEVCLLRHTCRACLNADQPCLSSQSSPTPHQ